MIAIHNPNRLHVQQEYDELFCGKKCKNKRERERIENERLKASVEAEKKQKQIEQQLLAQQAQRAKEQQEYERKLQQMQLETEKKMQALAAQNQQVILEQQNVQQAQVSTIVNQSVIYIGVVIGIVLLIIAYKKFKK